MRFRASEPARRPGPRCALVLLAALGACGSCDSPERTANVGTLTVDVPDDWTVELEREQAVEQLALRPPRPTVLCRVVVLRGKQGARAPEPAQFIERSKQRFGGSEHAQMALDASVARLEGISLHGVRMPNELRTIGDDARVEVYAARHGEALVGAVIGWFRGKEEDQRLRDVCFDALETLRSSG